MQLVQGRAGSEKRFGDPRAAAERWQEAGAEWIHLVDLDAAFGRGSNAEIVSELTSHLRLNVELSGGIRDDESLERALATGCARVNIGTAALERPEWCEEIVDRYGERIAIGLDVRGSKLAARGWTREGGDLFETLHRLDRAGCARFVVTDVSADGMLRGPNFDVVAPGMRRDRAAGDSQRRHLHYRRHLGPQRHGGDWGGRCHHWHRALRRPLHHRGGPGGRAAG